MYSLTMFKMWRAKKMNTQNDVKDVARRQLRKNRAVLESLREYDEGKKEIPTADVRKHLPNLQSPS
jgi:hypothetical protein